MLLSLIIPIYNVEKYIEECLESVCCQLVAGVEVILVNDGTPDSSMLIARKYISERYNHLKEQFVFIDQENQGLSGARNTGISVSKGEYIAFLDSDDILSNKYFDEIIPVIDNYHVEIIQFNAKRFDSDKKIYSSFLKNLNLKGFYEVDKSILLKVYNHSAWFVWMRIYHSKFFKDRRFPIGRNYEDACVIPYIFHEVKNIYFLESFLINYRVNSNSITAVKSKKNIEDLGFAIDLMIDFLFKEPLISTSIVSLSQHYINDSYRAEGFYVSKKRWDALKCKIKKNPSFNVKYVKNTGNKLFYFLGVYFFKILVLFNYFKNR
ncbi:glycosyltransferase family 2 protein [Acinetobacter pseudolwoffii]|uniref:Glycosyltransferase 2-like domain-containing protein n=2 Tax=Acinetobacter pseudolwoffii TaxID=2053287 RepID=A0A2H9YQ07_9GAMM|nr:glycosyltransferase [Acinetobacter pseudolwoffii]PJO74727.1 hypothetical protein CWI32_11700 [Acinetobacter pseudolwoffii]